MSTGEALARARRGAGLTVAQVSQRTRIRETIVTGIEDDDYSACGGDFYARGHIRAIARAVGADPEPLIRQYDTALRGVLPFPADVTEPVTPTGEYNTARRGAPALPADVAGPVTPGRRPGRRLLTWIAALALALALALGFAAYHFAADPRQAASAAPAARAHQATRHQAGHRTPAPALKTTPKPATRGIVPARALTPARARAFGPSGTGQGDNPQRAHLAIDGSAVTAWHTDWYTTARFGNLYPGTGLLVDMGRPVTITAVSITLGRAHGARFQVRAGAAPSLADLPPVASAASAGGLVRLRMATPARGRYVLIWFTRLPPDPVGTFQASVRNIRLEGRP